MNRLNFSSLIKMIVCVSTLVLTTLTYALPPTSSDYVQDAQISYNNDIATDAFSLIKTVACMLTNTKPEQYTGVPSYVAWVSKTACNDSNQTVTTSTSSADNNPHYAKTTISSSFDANGLNVKLWLRNPRLNENTVPPQWTDEIIFVKVLVKQGVALTPPLGTWVMDYCIVPNTSSSTCSNGHGHAEVSPSQLRIYQKNLWDDNVTTQTNVGTINYVLTNGQIVSGVGIVDSADQGPGLGCGSSSCSDEYYSRFAFGGNFYLAHILEGAGTPKDICYDRRASNAIASPWQTWLYNNDPSVTSGNGAYGSRTKLNGGFTILKTDGTRGWFSYWGMWFPDGVTRPANGDTVTSDQNGSGSTKSYTYRKTVGKLYKNLISKTALSGTGFDGVSFIVSLPANTATSNGSGTAAPISSQVQMHWSSANANFVVESINGDNSGVNSGKTLSISQLLAATGQLVANQSSIWAWQNNSPVNYQLVLGDYNCTGGCSVKPRSTSAAYAITRQRTQVMPGSADAISLVGANLICTGACIGTSGTFIEASPYNSVQQANPVTYRLDASGNMTVYSGKTQANVSVSTGAITQPGSGSNYSETRPLILSTDVNSLNAVTCNSSQYCGWQADTTVSSYYSYGVGPNTWDNTEFLVDGGNPVVFDQPLNLTYAVNQSGSPYDGKTAYLQYNGNGDLNIPGHCVNRNNPSQTVDCNNGSDNFYKTDFIIPPYAGTLNDIGSPNATQISQSTLNAQSSSATYLGKWLRRGTVYSSTDVTLPATKAASSCSAMNTPAVGDLPLPGESDFVNPASSSSANYIGPWQEPTAAPSITDGIAN